MKKAITIFLMFIFANSMAFNDEIASDSHYCEMVKSGYWGDYNKEISCDSDEYKKNLDLDYEDQGASIQS